jgi:hypothetical protein
MFLDPDASEDVTKEDANSDTFMILDDDLYQST